MSRLLWNNPVLVRELQERVLSRRTMIITTVWLLVLCGTTALYYAGEATNTFSNQFDPFSNSVLELASVGQKMFDWLLFFMVGLVLFLVPGFTAASIAGERERQTLLPMQVTLLRPIDIVVGKVLASVVFVLVLIAVTSPILAFAYVVGGITIRDVVLSLAMMAFSALALACVTVACSAAVRRIPTAIVTAYGVIMALAVGSFVVYGLASVIDESRGFDVANPPNTLLAVNPVVAVAVASGEVDEDTFSYGAETPMAALRELVDLSEFDEFGGPRFPPEGIPVPAIEGDGGVQFPPDVNVVDFDPEGIVRVNPNVRAIDAAVPFVVQYLIAMTVLSLLSVWFAARRLRTPAKAER